MFLLGCSIAHQYPNPLHSVAEETEDLAFDASDEEVKDALEALGNVGTVDVTREDGGGGLYAWHVTFTEPTLPAYSNAHLGDSDGSEVDPAAATLSFPLLYAGGGDDDGGLGLGTLGAGGQLNVTRERRGTLGPLSGEVSVHFAIEAPKMRGKMGETSSQRYSKCMMRCTKGGDGDIRFSAPPSSGRKTSPAGCGVPGKWLCLPFWASCYIYSRQIYLSKRQPRALDASTHSFLSVAVVNRSFSRSRVSKIPLQRREKLPPWPSRTIPRPKG